MYLQSMLFRSHSTPEGLINGNWNLPMFSTGKIGFGSLGLGITNTKMGRRGLRPKVNWEVGPDLEQS